MGLRLGIGIEDWGLGLEILSGEWDRELRSGIGIRDWD